MASIGRTTTSKGIRYKVRVRLDGVSMTETFPTLREANAWAARTEAQIRGGGAVQATVTARELIDRYIEDVLPFKARGKDQRHPIARLRYWRDALGNLFLSNITPDLLSQHRSKLLRGRSPSTVNRYFSALSAALSEAVRLGWLHTNPARHLCRLQEPRARDRTLSPDERQRLLAVCDADLYLLIILALTTAARKSELYSLLWSNVDLKKCRLLFVDTKNTERRGIAIAGKPLELLRQRRRTGPKVFPVKLEKRWRKARMEAGITDLHFHDLRHTAITNMARNGASMPQIMQISGHKTAAMTKRYTHLNPDDTLSVIKDLSKQFKN